MALGSQISALTSGQTTPFTSKFFDQLIGSSGIYGGIKAFFSLPSLLGAIFEKGAGRPVNQTIKTTTFAESNLKATASGSLTQESIFGNAYFSNPGSLSSTTFESGLKPAYNNILGVFNLIEKPTFEAAEYLTASYFTNQQISNSTACIYDSDCPYVPEVALPIWQYKVSGNLKYVLNPASGLKINKMQVGMVFPIGKDHIPTYNNQLTPTYSGLNSPAWNAINEDNLNKMGYNLIVKKDANSFVGAVVSTQFVPVSCMDKLSFFVGGDVSQYDSIGLRIFLEMEPITPLPGTNVDKILQIYTFYYSPSEIIRHWGYGQYIDVASVNQSGMVTNAGSLELGDIKWPNTFAGLPTNVKITNQVVSSDIVSFRDLEIGPNVIYSGSNLKFYVMGNVINNSGVPFPPANVTVINNVKDPCGLLTTTTTDPTSFCNSTRYTALSAILAREEGNTTSQHQNNASNFITSIGINPNPAVNQTMLSIKLKKESHLKIAIFSSIGSLMSEVVNNSIYSAGLHTINLSTEALKNGVYIVRIQNKDFMESRKLVIKK
jgi:hypothetical protein